MEPAASEHFLQETVQVHHGRERGADEDLHDGAGVHQGESVLVVPGCDVTPDQVTTEQHEAGHLVREEMGFYVPAEHQDGTPQPTANTDVNIVTRPEMIAYVREFGGYAKEQDWQDQKELLRRDLQTRDDYKQIDIDTFYRCKYYLIFLLYHFSSLSGKALMLLTSSGAGKMKYFLQRKLPNETFSDESFKEAT